MDDVSDQLVLVSLLGDIEVDERALGLDLGRLIGVGEHGLHVHAELKMDVELEVVDLEDHIGAALDEIAANHTHDGHLGLARALGAGRRAAHHQVQSLSRGFIDKISEWHDDKDKAVT